MSVSSSSSSSSSSFSSSSDDDDTTKKMFEHEHPINLIDLWSEQIQYKEESDEDDEKEDMEDLTMKQDFRCSCFQCEEEINWLHRYYYKCGTCDYSIHKFCGELPERWETTFHSHTLYLFQRQLDGWFCDICFSIHRLHELSYNCPQCEFDVDIKCAQKLLQKKIIYHPSHIHPLVCISKQLLGECDACGKEHKGIFYLCNMCSYPFIHNHCAFLPQKLLIQHTSNNIFSHIHPLTLAYSFPKPDQKSKFFPRCRVCLKLFENRRLWIYKCEKCRYYTHLDCATSRNEPFMSILMYPGTGKTVKNYEDSHYLNLVHLPFPDPSYTILKHLFFKENGSNGKQINEVTTSRYISHQHPLVLVNKQCSDFTSPTLSSRIKSISFHDPMKRIELLCNACVKPITTTPIYMCGNEDEHCNYVLHEWCSRLPTELKYLQHTLKLYSKHPNSFFGVFGCDFCQLYCNGFVYYSEEYRYSIDVNCAYLPNEITHSSHPNHLLIKDYKSGPRFLCQVCYLSLKFYQFSYGCQTCKFHLHPECALLIPETITHKCDKHPLKLSYLPIENHKSEYFCEVCEEEFNPNISFYHCHECMQSIHTECAPLILQNERHMRGKVTVGVYEYINVKFGGTYMNTRIHPHPLSFDQGIANDGECDKCGSTLQYHMIFKCLNCKFAFHFFCFE